MNNASELIHSGEQNSFCNNFFWVIFNENLIEKVEQAKGLTIDDQNYKEIFNHLSDCLKIDDVILNTEDYPYLSSVVKNAKLHNEKMHNIIYDDMLDINDFETLKKFNILNKESFNKNPKKVTINDINIDKYLEIKKDIHLGIYKFFQEAKDYMKEQDVKNVDFIDIFEVENDVLKLFIEFNENDPEVQNDAKNFQSRINNYLLLNNQSRMNKVDIGKLFSLVFSGDSCKNTLFADFDQVENFNINLCDNDQECAQYPKFSLMRFSGSAKSVFTTGCHAALVYSSELSKKLFLMLLDHTLSNQDKVLSVSPNSGPICVEKRFEILFEFLATKDFTSLNDFENYVKKTEYKEIYQEFDDFFQDYKDYNGHQIREGYYKNHFANKAAENFHIYLEEKKLYGDDAYFCTMPKNFEDIKNLLKLEDCIESQCILINEVSHRPDKEIGKTWLRDPKELSSMKKKDLFDFNHATQV